MYKPTDCERKKNVFGVCVAYDPRDLEYMTSDPEDSMDLALLLVFLFLLIAV
jgi:hypothetical protein